MKLAQLEMVNRIADARKAALHRIDVLQVKPAPGSFSEPSLTVAIDGNRQGDDIVALVRPLILGELRARVRELERDLEGLGVSLS